MRIRTIKPEFWKHPIMSRKHDTVRLCAIGVLNIADDEGYFLAEPSMVRSELWPWDDDSGRARKALTELASIDYIQIRECARVGFVAWIVQFTTHQRVDKPKPSRLSDSFKSGIVVKSMIEKDSTNDLGRVDDASSNDRRTIVERSSLEGKGKEVEGKGVEGKGKQVKNNPVARGSSGPPLAADPESGSKSAETWASYASAYQDRYHVEPVRNAKVNAQIAQFVSRIGVEEAPLVAAFYLTINKAFYVEKGHAVDILLKDAESLRMQWARGRGITRAEAQQADAKAARGNAFAPLLLEAQGESSGDQ